MMLLNPLLCFQSGCRLGFLCGKGYICGYVRDVDLEVQRDSSVKLDNLVYSTTMLDRCFSYVAVRCYCCALMMSKRNAFIGFSLIFSRSLVFKQGCGLFVLNLSGCFFPFVKEKLYSKLLKPRKYSYHVCFQKLVDWRPSLCMHAHMPQVCSDAYGFVCTNANRWARLKLQGVEL